MRKVSRAVATVCLIWVLTGCSNYVPEEETLQSFSNIGSVEVSEETESEGQSDKIHSAAEENNGQLTEQEEQEQIQSGPQVQNEPVEGNGLELKEMSVSMKINDEIVAVTWEDNESVAALMELLREQPMSIQMSMYGGFEQVGSFGTSLPREDEQTTAQAGDIVLYSGSQMVVFYGSNSWAYTRLGRITDKSAEELKEMLGDGDVTVTLELVS